MQNYGLTIMMISKTIVYKSRSAPLEILEREIPLPLSPDFVLVKTSYTSLNPIDIKRKSLAYLGGGTVGHDFAGTIEAVASNIDQFGVGDRVCGVFKTNSGFVGSYSLVNVKQESIIHVPDGLNDVEAAALPLVFQAALSVVEAITPITSSKILVLGGATSVGSLVIQLLAKAHNIDNITSTCSPRSFAYVKSIGAKAVVDYTDNMPEQLIASAEPKFNAIIDTVGGYGALSVYDKILEKSGIYLTIAGDTAPTTYEKTLNRALLCSLPRMGGRLAFGRLLGINWRMLLSSSSQLFNNSGGIISDHGIKVRVDSVYPLSEAQTAWDKLNSIGVSGKVVIEF